MSKNSDLQLQLLVNEAIKSQDYIIPKLCDYEIQKLILLINDFIASTDSIKGYYRSITSSKEYKNREIEKKISLNKFHKEVIKCWGNFPKNLVKDIYKLYYYKINDLQFTNKSEKNHVHYKMLTIANKPIAKIMTEGSVLKSIIYTRSIIILFLIQFAKMSLFRNIDDQFMNASLKIKDGIDLNEWESKFNTMQEEPLNKRLKQICTLESRRLAKDIDSLMSIEKQDDITNYLSAGKTGPKKEDLLSRFTGKLLQINLATHELNEWIKELLEKSKKYHQVDENIEYETLIESDNTNSFNNYHLLHPEIRKLFIYDILIKKNNQKNTLNLYIDISGSMDAWKMKEEGEVIISSLDFAKALAVEMSNQNIIEDVYLFNQDIIPFENSVENLAKITAQGGTDIRKVVEHVKKIDKKAIVITDAIDKCDLYSDLVYFIGVKGANFKFFSKDCLEKYTNQEQMILFDGKEIKTFNIKK